MEKMNMHTSNLAEENYKKLAELFPNVVTETINELGEVERAIDADILCQEISHKVVAGREERYQFTWPDKKKAILAANAPISATLRPCKEESVDFDNTQNLYIEGDNLDVLKLLRETYLGKIKMIYIDPPYNTGNDFLFEDDFAEDAEEYLSRSGQYDEAGNRLVANTDSNGRFHTDWLNRMYPRLKLARDLITEDGVIFISIDDNEQENLKKICNEVFGNDVETFVWRKSGIGRDGKMKNTTTFRNDHEYILVCYKNEHKLNKSFELPQWENDYGNPDNDIRGPYKPGSISNKESASNPNHPNYYSVISPSGKVFTRQFNVPKDEFDKLNNDNRIYWGKNGDAVPAIKIFVNEKRIVTTSSIIDDKKCTTTEGSKELSGIMQEENIGNQLRPKPSALIKKLIVLGSQQSSIILDFFSGSATTAHAIMQLNAEDGGKRKFIMVQLPEKCDEKSEAYKAGYKNICEIGKERIRRAGKKIKEENPMTTHDLDIGFRVLKLDSSNMDDIYYSPDKLGKQDLFKDNVKPDRTPMDLLFQVMLEKGIPLSSKIESKAIDGKTVWYVDGNYLVSCFDTDVTEETITTIAKEKPYYFVMRDSSLADDSVATNFEQIFKTYLGKEYKQDTLSII